MVFLCPNQRYGWLLEYTWIKAEDGTAQRVTRVEVQRVNCDE